MKRLETKEDAVELLGNIGANEKLIKHVELVGEAGEEIIRKLEGKKVKFDKNYVRIGIILHDIGKILHPNDC